MMGGLKQVKGYGLTKVKGDYSYPYKHRESKQDAISNPNAGVKRQSGILQSEAHSSYIPPSWYKWILLCQIPQFPDTPVSLAVGRLFISTSSVTHTTSISLRAATITVPYTGAAGMIDPRSTT